MGEIRAHLVRVQEIGDRARAFNPKEASDSKEFSATVVEDLGALADALVELMTWADI